MRSLEFLRENDYDGSHQPRLRSRREKFKSIDTDRLANHIYTTIGAEINHSGGAGNYYDGEIAEVLVYRRALSDAETAQVQDWLAERYVRCVIGPYENDLALHCRMDDKDARRGTTSPPPALSTADGDWTVRSTTNNHAFTASGSRGFRIPATAPSR